jgi:hypothetical protein
VSSCACKKWKEIHSSESESESHMSRANPFFFFLRVGGDPRGSEVGGASLVVRLRPRVAHHDVSETAPNFLL